MKQEFIEKIFDEINERFEFEVTNAENKDDLIERLEKAFCEIKKEYLSKAK